MGFLSEIWSLFFGQTPKLAVELQQQRLLPHREAPARINGRKVVQRDTRPLWMQKRWKQSGIDFIGFYRCRYGAWKGRIEVSPSGKAEIFIRNPPKAVQSHPKWECFGAIKDGWYHVHYHGNLKELSDAIVEIESILIDSFEKYFKPE